jgi:signal transduction histidine kinase
MKRVTWAWLVFAVCVAVAAAAMARLGSTALALERAEARARRQAALEENLRLALWRMDSTLAPLMAEESARPYFTYSPLYPAERAFTRMFAEIQRGDVLMPSPLLTFASPQIRLHFQYGPDGRLSSPQAPAGNMRDLAETRYLTPEQCEDATRRLAELGKLVSRDKLEAKLAADDLEPSMNQGLSFVYDQTNPLRDSQEFMMRSRSTKLAQNAAPAQAQSRVPQTPVRQGSLRAFWVGPALVLARRVRVEEGTFLQGCWLDWDVIRRDLEQSAADLLPRAVLEPAYESSPEASSRLLASLPARLVADSLPFEPESTWSPARLTLWIAWACLGLAALAVGLLLHGALALSERRGTFVSAVTHELRTPLTTFRLYTEMLDEGMVQSAEAQRDYLKTLRGEADRLGHLVENVLSFAQLERGRAADRRETVMPSALLERLTPRLAIRAEHGGMKLVVGPCEVSTPVCVDLSLVDQILSNLVDNAIKYAGDAPDHRIHLDTANEGRSLLLIVRDHGSGLPRRALGRLFRPFSKSAHDAAASAPGVGLGLALSRRLARAMGGDLKLSQNGDAGAVFTLCLPLA